MLVSRVIQIIKSRGFYGFLRFLVSRIYRSTNENKYQKTSTNYVTDSPYSNLAQEYEFSIIDQSNYQDEKYKCLINSINYGEIAEYIEGIKRDSLLFLISKNNEVLHISFVQFKSRYKKLIQENNESPLIGNCWTDGNYRGNGFYPFTIFSAAEELFRRNYHRVIISCTSDNIASIKGIEKSGFELVSHIKSYIFFNKFVIQLCKNGTCTSSKSFLF